MEPNISVPDGPMSTMKEEQRGTIGSWLGSIAVQVIALIVAFIYKRVAIELTLNTGLSNLCHFLIERQTEFENRSERRSRLVSDLRARPGEGKWQRSSYPWAERSNRAPDRYFNLGSPLYRLPTSNSVADFRKPHCLSAISL